MMSAMNSTERTAIFEIKQKFMREIPHPKLIQKQIKRAETLGNLSAQQDLNYQQFSLNAAENEADLHTFLSQHIIETSQRKHKVTQAQTFDDLRNALIALYAHQLSLLLKLQNYVDSSWQIEDDKIKMSAPIDAYEILKRIRELNLDENEIKDYLCKEIMVEKRAIDVIVVTCLRAHKILRHG